ncbi:carbohydrate kinase family protein [Nocardioides sp. cx-173]|uniref:carbohydrate kinase family protein n=1 Tax=Nocardioides sp. cx-173 TaxID=2898796 RepID=UPI001E49F626|nr:carbohydrate kinase family protein [Nocardioides sp. cx-173]MCD4523799.1 carbohydrate kinase family protein [Nocardioides sp. cx-173]UGB41879.1 carbohydrate kinase family protein [Nocardioides sp. cx-173]
MTVVVIGGANLDLKARTTSAVVRGTSNPGTLSTSPGGVGRNIAENLARLGTPTALVAAVGDDVFGDDLVATTAGAGVEVSGVRRVAGATGTYLAVLEPSGELSVGVADMAATATLGPEHLDAHLIASADLVVLDGNLRNDTLAAAWTHATEAGVRVLLDPVSVAKAAALAPLVGERPLWCATPNTGELAVLGGSPAALRARDVELVWVRRGPCGSVLSGPDGETQLATVPGEVVDVTGAGDAMLAAFCHAVLGGASPSEAAAYGHAAAALTVASPDTVRRDLTDELVRSRL